MANHEIFRDFFLTQHAKFGANPARFFATLCNFRSAVLRDFLRSYSCATFNKVFMLFMYSCMYIYNERSNMMYQLAV